MEGNQRSAGKTRTRGVRRLGSSRRRSAGGPLREGPLTVFVHIPKTAGTTFTAVLGDNFPGGVSGVGNAFKGVGGFDTAPIERLRDAPVLRTRDMHVLTGHLPFAVRNVLPADTRYITFLRDPVERTLSQYYGLLKLSRRRPLPGDGSLAAVLAEGNIIFDNLQTRMLANDESPVGEIDEGALEQAKENLARGFTAFGLVERFDESLVLFKKALDLRSITYVHQRGTTRPRGSEVPEENVRLAREANRYDEELYSWAQELFEQRVAEQGLDFVADVAALEVARTGAPPQAPPSGAVEDPQELWDLLVRARAELFIDRRERVVGALADRAEMRGLLLSLDKSVSELSKRQTAKPAAEAKPGRKDRPGRGADPAGDGSAEAAGEARSRTPRERGNKNARLAARAAEVVTLREEAVTRLEEINERIRTIEGAGGGEGSIEIERLRREAAQLTRRVQQLTSRATQAQEKLGQVAGEGEDDAPHAG